MYTKLKTTPLSGLLVITSYNTTYKSGHYQIFDIARRCFLYQKKKFKFLDASDNVIGFLGITQALNYVAENSFIGMNVYAANSVSLQWAKKRICKTKKTGERIASLIKGAEWSLGMNPYVKQALLWEGAWGKPSFFPKSFNDEAPF
jgi:hypothetical protein